MDRKELEFRPLNASEIECKAVIVERQLEISLHTTAAVCTRILNETVGVMNWEKEYTNGNKNCIVKIWDKDRNCMISKEDCGGSLTEVDGLKGQASNGFKRVCALGWGLGIELYSQPEILLPVTDDNVTVDTKGWTVIEKYSVKEIEYDDNKYITHCVIVDSHGTVVYDGPNAEGKSNITPPAIADEPLVIPEDTDIQNAQIIEESDDLPDNTDGFESEMDDFMSQSAPYSSIDYSKEIEREIQRTHVRRSDVLKALKISSFDEIDTVSDDLLDETLRRLQAVKTYGKK
jgi:hypothetical protein